MKKMKKWKKMKKKKLKKKDAVCKSLNETAVSTAVLLVPGSLYQCRHKHGRHV